MIATLFGAVRAFLNPGALYAIGGALLIGIASGAFGTYKIMSWREGAAETKTVVATLEETRKQDAITETVSEKTAEKEAEVRVVTQTIIQKERVYVTKKADDRCIVPRGAVLMHDAAARAVPVVPHTAGKPDGGPAWADDPSGLILSQLLNTVAQNYGRCNEVRGQLTGLQDWVRQQQALSAKR